ncbi:MAG: TetR/AcrR family transcriptional regulator [Microscillaceae bacterium]|nr:TetR/AcrR family transcriptional regulator [Microscillaceae bacterium]
MKIVATVKINVPEDIYLRDPEQTKLGRKIIHDGINLIDELGFEAFTFGKLAKSISSTEASIYRYFDNKHNLLVYLVSWYWSWLEYQIDYQTNNIEDSEKKLKIVIRIISDIAQKESSFSHINEQALHRIVVSESLKAYYTKSVDAENQLNYFRSYKSLCLRIAAIMLELNANYPYARALSSTILESAHQQIYFSQHLPSLTELRVKNNEDYIKVVDYLENLVFNQLK